MQPVAGLAGQTRTVTLPRHAVTAVALAVVMAGCARGSRSADSTSVTPSTAEPEAPAATTTTTTTVPPTTTLPGLGPGARGPEVRAMEQRLTGLRYDVGKVDGVFDATTAHGVMAFQKVSGMARTGRATPDVLARLSRAGPPQALLPTGGPTRVEIDLRRQVLFLWKEGALLRVLPVSTGTGRRYCVEGSCATAVTPGGSYRVGAKIRGLRVSRLGQLYNPLYFNGGIAIHGSTSVPGTPASHDYVRIPMSASLWFFDTVPSGTPV